MIYSDIGRYFRLFVIASPIRNLGLVCAYFSVFNAKFDREERCARDDPDFSAAPVFSSITITLRKMGAKTGPPHPKHLNRKLVMSTLSLRYMVIAGLVLII